MLKTQICVTRPQCVNKANLLALCLYQAVTVLNELSLVSVIFNAEAYQCSARHYVPLVVQCNTVYGHL